MIVDLPITKGCKIKFLEEKQRYTVMAIGERYAVCNKPMNALKTYLYTVIDFGEEIRGTENLVFRMGAETEKDCEEMLGRLEIEDKLKREATKVSHRNRIPLNIISIECL